MRRLRIILAYWVAALAFFTPGAAHAYIDPATTTYLIQIVTALVVTLGVSLSIFLYRFHMISAKIKYGLYGLIYRLRQGGTGSSGPREEEGAPQNDRHCERSESIHIAPPDYVICGAPEPPTAEGMTALGVQSDMECMERVSGKAVAPERRGYAGRLKAALPVLLAVCLGFILFGCTDLVIQNPADMPFRLSDVIAVIILAAAVCFLVLLFVVPIFRGKAYKILILAAAAIMTAGYIQGTFLNSGLGKLTGDEIDWGAHMPLMVGSVLLWAAVFAAVFLLAHFSRAAYKGLLIFVPVLLIVMQGAGLASLMTEKPGTSEPMAWEELSEMLTIEGLLSLASEKNAIIFVLDRLDQDYVDGAIAEDPHFLDKLDGFTMFDDNISYAASTFPSVTGMLTGHIYRWDRSDDDYFEYAWENARLIRTLKEQGVDIRFYMDSGYVYGDIGQLKGIASNIREGRIGVNGRIALVKLLRLSAFRYAPAPVKQVFWMPPNELIEAMLISDENAPYFIDDFAFYGRLMQYGLTVEAYRFGFAYIHMHGPHGPLLMDENIERISWSTPVKQTIGSMKIVYEYLDRMKALGLYEDATIIITGDHGTYAEEGLIKPALTALFVKPSGSAGTPLTLSHAPVCPDQLHRTIMEGLLGEGGEFSPGYMEIEEGADAVREYDFRRDIYTIEGDGRDFANWSHTGVYPDEWESKVN